MDWWTDCMNVISELVLAVWGILYPREADFPEEYSGRLCSAQKALSVDVSEILTMYLIAENLVNNWDVIKDEFKKTKTLEDKHLLIAMMYQPWELCDDTFTEWSAANKITLPEIIFDLPFDFPINNIISLTLPAKHTLRTVAAKYLYSDWVWLLCYISQIVYTTIPHP